MTRDILRCHKLLHSNGFVDIQHTALDSLKCLANHTQPVALDSPHSTHRSASSITQGISTRSTCVFTASTQLLAIQRIKPLPSLSMQLLNTINVLLPVFNSTFLHQHLVLGYPTQKPCLPARSFARRSTQRSIWFLVIQSRKPWHQQQVELSCIVRLDILVYIIILYL